MSRGFSFSSWIKPDHVIGGYDNERQIFSTDDGGWDWSMSIRYGSLSVWNGNSRIQSGFQVYSNEWYHVVVVFDPILGRTTLHLNGKSVTLDSLGFDNNDDLVTVGWQRDGRTFDGLIDDVRMWGRPIQSDEVLSLWGGGLGDIGPRAKFLFDNPIYGSEINATVVINQSISDINASTDLDLIGMTLKSSSSEVDSNTSIYNLILEPVSFSESNLSISLKSGSVTGQFGGKNETFSDIINFRPHRIRENDLVLWWELNEGSGTVISDSSGNGYAGIFSGSWGDSSQSKFGFSHTDFNKLNGQAIRFRPD